MHVSLKNWHTFLDTKNPKILDELLADEVIFYSPIVWAPQEGKQITKLYLMAALEVFGGENADFRYVNQVVANKQFILEFVTLIDGITVNGVDMIELNADGKIISFKVMVRPLKAINKVHEKMGEMLEKLKNKKRIGN
ncbi:MAG: nuclear transport factor 2 family protein [Lutibacter sp.]|nr:nuclear transport factor 2 family protein [Lutibacter sp.]MDT8417370.1 nuclear transport factor 2 family protein [Lutibacter sp.]